MLPLQVSCTYHYQPPQGSSLRPPGGGIPCQDNGPVVVATRYTFAAGGCCWWWWYQRRGRHSGMELGVGGGGVSGSGFQHCVDFCENQKNIKAGQFDGSILFWPTDLRPGGQNEMDLPCGRLISP